MGKIFCLMGKSSSGKDTIYKKVLEQVQNLKPIVLYTTRPIRTGEKDGETYFFVDERELERLEQNNKIIEQRAYNTVQGVWKYFTADDGQFQLDKYSYLLIGTLESFEKIKEYFGKEVVLPIYIDLDDGIRLQRALDREKAQDIPKYAEMCRRYLADEEDFSEENIGQAGITEMFVNTDIGTCVAEILDYIKSHTMTF